MQGNSSSLLPLQWSEKENHRTSYELQIERGLSSIPGTQQRSNIRLTVEDQLIPESDTWSRGLHCFSSRIVLTVMP
jgi:hypothetical protein